MFRGQLGSQAEIDYLRAAGLPVGVEGVNLTNADFIAAAASKLRSAVEVQTTFGPQRGGPTAKINGGFATAAFPSIGELATVIIPGIGQVTKGAIEALKGILGTTTGKIATGAGVAAGAAEIAEQLGVSPEALGLLGAAGKRRGRRMNILNPRALRRSMRRVQGFAKFASKTISFTKRVKMKKRRR